MPDLTVVRQQRAARNQTMFREINERLEHLTGEADTADQRFVCECAEAGCIEPIDLTVEEYERVRRDGATFLVAPGHVYPEVERVLVETGRYAIVEKRGAAAELALAHDPRART
jgi:hypothetical protein